MFAGKLSYHRFGFRDYVMNARNKEDIMKNFAQLIVYYERLSITKIEEIPAYSLNQLFSDIGMNYM